MHVAKVFSAQFDILNSFIVEVEVDINKKTSRPTFKIVGLPDKAVDESRERVSAAIRNIGFKDEHPCVFKITTSLSPANEKKTGPLFDLPIAIGFLLANNEIDFDIKKKIFIGELSLNGSLKKVDGVLAMIKKAKEKGFLSAYLPQENAEEASLIQGINIFPVKSLLELINHLRQEKQKQKVLSQIINPYKRKEKEEFFEKNQIDFSDIVSQDITKRALEIAAAGGHNIAMYGPPGTGKTMLARAFSSILPKLSYRQSLEVTEIHSVAGILNKSLIINPPFRSPHHTASYVAIIGGGTYPKPGEVTLAHRGILFLDEFVEFEKRVLESLREPLEDNFVNISRAKASVKFPANFTLIAALNPPSEVFRTGGQITYAEEKAFKKKLSGPIMDRIDLWTEVSKIDDYKKLSQKNEKSEKSEKIRKRVEKAREIQKTRYNKEILNANLNAKDIKKYLILSNNQENILIEAVKKLNFSPRVYHKILKITQTIADLDNVGKIKDKHILEALQYRPKEII